MTKNVNRLKIVNIKNRRRIFAALSEADLIRGKNGISIYQDFSKLPEEVEDCSYREINRSYRVEGE